MTRFHAAILTLIFTTTAATAVAHDPYEEPGAPPHVRLAGERIWTHASGRYRVEGSFVGTRGGQVLILTHDGETLDMKLEALSETDRRWVRERTEAITRLNERPRIILTSQAAAKRVGPAPEIAKAFEPFAPKIKTRWDDRFFYVESDGIPDHQMMVGIRSWQQQVPLPQAYVGDNAWSIPLHPVPARRPMSTRNNFLRGAIALASNGIPIFNPLNNRGDDAFLFGELDDYGGHCGRADDYHYHLAPVHLQKTVGKGVPIAYGLDGYPVLGFEEADGSKVAKLDALNGHDLGGGYHYHATKTYPYLIGAFRGEVKQVDGQVDPQPRAEPARPSLPPMRGAKITGFAWNPQGKNLLTYEVEGRKGYVEYTIGGDGNMYFTFTDPDGRKRVETYRRGRQGGGGGGGGGGRGGRGGGRPPRPEDGPPPDEKGGRPAPLATALDRDGDGEISPEELAAAAESLRKLDRNGDGILTTAELGIEAAPAPAPAPGPRGDDAGEEIPKDFGGLEVASDAFAPGGKLPVEFTCDGDSASPPIAWTKAPAGVKSYAVTLWHVPPDGGVKSYWVVYDIPAGTEEIPKNARRVGTIGLNGKRRNEYDPMCSKGPGLKTYHVTVHALSKTLGLPASRTGREELLKAMDGAELARKTISFTYERSGNE